MGKRSIIVIYCYSIIVLYCYSIIVLYCYAFGHCALGKMNRADCKTRRLRQLPHAEFLDLRQASPNIRSAKIETCDAYTWLQQKRLSVRHDHNSMRKTKQKAETNCRKNYGQADCFNEVVVAVVVVVVVVVVVATVILIIVTMKKTTTTRTLLVFVSLTCCSARKRQVRCAHGVFKSPFHFLIDKNFKGGMQRADASCRITMPY